MPPLSKYIPGILYWSRVSGIRVSGIGYRVSGIVMALYGTIRPCMDLYGTVRPCMALYGLYGQYGTLDPALVVYLVLVLAIIDPGPVLVLALFLALFLACPSTRPCPSLGPVRPSVYAPVPPWCGARVLATRAAPCPWVHHRGDLRAAAVARTWEMLTMDRGPAAQGVWGSLPSAPGDRLAAHVTWPITLAILYPLIGTPGWPPCVTWQCPIWPDRAMLGLPSGVC